MCRIIRKMQCPRPMRQNSQNRSSNRRIAKIDEKASKKRSKKTSRKTRPERPQKTPKMTPKRYSRAPRDPPGTPETSILGVPARDRNFDQKTEPQKIGFFRVLGDFRPPLGNQKPGTGRVGGSWPVSRLEVLSTLRGEIDVFAWEALRFSRFRASLKSRPPATASKMLCLSDESRAKKVGLVICHAGASGEARRIRGAAPKPPRLFSVVGLGAVCGTGVW